MRVGEALAVQGDDVHLNDMDGGYIRVVGKGDRERIIPLIDAPRSLRLLRPLVKPTTTRVTPLGPLFHGAVSKGGRMGEPLDDTTVFYHFERYLAAARRGRPEANAAERAPITIHRLRHTYATERLRGGEPGRWTQADGASKPADDAALCRDRPGQRQAGVGRRAPPATGTVSRGDHDATMRRKNVASTRGGRDGYLPPARLAPQDQPDDLVPPAPVRRPHPRRSPLCAPNRFGWSDEHLHRFALHGREYGIPRLGGPWYNGDARKVRLADLGLRPRERFLLVQLWYCPSQQSNFARVYWSPDDGVSSLTGDVDVARLSGPDGGFTIKSSYYTIAPYTTQDSPIVYSPNNRAVATFINASFAVNTNAY